MLKAWKWCWLLLAFWCANALADDAHILKLTGKVGYGNGGVPGKTQIVSLTDLRALPQKTILTTTRWTLKTAFTGPLIADVLAHAGIPPDAKEVMISTVDDYPVLIPLADFRKWGVILAWEADGRQLTLANKGPLWIMYPLDEHPEELQTNLIRQRLAWGVKGMEVR